MENPFEELNNRLINIEEMLVRILEKKEPIVVAETDERMNIVELAKYLEVERSTVQRYKRNRVFPFYQAGRTVYFKRSEVDAALSSIKPINKHGNRKTN